MLYVTHAFYVTHYVKGYRLFRTILDVGIACLASDSSSLESPQAILHFCRPLIDIDDGIITSMNVSTETTSVSY